MGLTVGQPTAGQPTAGLGFTAYGWIGTAYSWIGNWDYGLGKI